MSKKPSTNWRRPEPGPVVKPARDVRLREASGTYGSYSDEPADGSLRRLLALDRALGDWERVREWRLSLLAALFPGRKFE